MLDHLDQCGGIVAAEPRVAVGERALQQLDALALLVGQPVKPLRRAGEAETPHLHADDLAELTVLDEATDELALAATEIEHALGAEALQRLGNRVEAEIVEPKRLLDRILGRILRRPIDGGLGRVLAFVALGEP